jgi:hypothetical protein
VTIDIDAARKLLDFGRRLGESQAARAEEQLEGAVALHNMLARHGVAYLADEVGMGKTYVALGALALFRHFNPRFRVLIIAPRQNIQSKWVKEFRNFVRHNVRIPDLRVRGLDLEPARPLVECERLSHFVREVSTDAERDFFLRMTSFSLPLQASEDSTTSERLREQFLRELPWIPPEALDLRGAGGTFKRNIARAINCVLPEFDLVIVDEAHHLKHGTQRAAARNEVLALMMGREVEETPRWAKNFGPRAKRVLFLSATPLEESFKHVWNQLDVFGKAGGFDELAAPRFDVDEATRKSVAQKFMIRRVTAIPIGQERYTKNRYRREWRHGGVHTFDEPIAVTDPKQRLVVALVQKKVSELLGSEKFGNRFQVGMLASFESFQETLAKKDDEAVFDGDQTEDELEKEGIDVKPLNTLARSYRATFEGRELPHPKLDAMVDALAHRWATGRKALVFVRRVASVKELKRKLDDRYDEWLEAKLVADLPTHAERLRSLFATYRREKTELRNANRDVVVGAESPSDTEEAGGADTFFAWFFRGTGPRGVFSGAALKKRFVSSSGVFATFFEENVVAVILGVSPPMVPDRLAELAGLPRATVLASLAEEARTLLPPGEKLAKAAQFEAAQAAAVRMLSKRTDEMGVLARHVWHQLYEGLGQRGTSRNVQLPIEPLLVQETFFTQLRGRPDLARLLLPDPLPSRPAEFDLHWFRVALLGSVARLGHALIDLYVTVVGRRPSLDLGKRDDEDEQGSDPTGRFLDLLAAQAALPAETRAFGALDELRLAAQNFDAIFDTNLTHLRDRKLSEVRRAVGSTLGEQQPVGGMHGGVNKSLISQFRMPGYPLVLVTTDLLQEGEDLHTFCSDVFHYGISWTPSAMEQRIGRIDRVRSQTDRLLSALNSRPRDEEKLQVFVPTLRESVEVLQVNRVLRRMNRFVELMHEGVGQLRDDGPKIDVEQESMESIEPPPPLPDVELKSSFRVQPGNLKGKHTSLDTSGSEAEAIVGRFRALCAIADCRGHRIDWEQVPTNRVDRLFGTVWMATRKQPFGLYLRLIGGRPLLKCVSPVGRVFDRRSAADVPVDAWTRIGVTAAGPTGSYDLTVEDEVLLGDAPSDGDRLRLLLSRVVTRADALELELLESDEPMDVFRTDLAAEGTHES